MPTFTTPAGGRLREYNRCHEPAGSAEGGRFAHRGTGNCDGPQAAPPHDLQVGITSYRSPEQPGPGDKTHAAAYARMDDLVADLERQGLDVTAQAAQGAWQGAWEPSWMVGIDPGESWDAGAAERTLAAYGKRFNQDAVLLMRQCAGEDCNSEYADLSFDRDLGQETRDAIGEVLAAQGMGGWTWYKGADGRTTVRMAHVPVWSDRTVEDHISAAGQIRAALARAGYQTEMRRTQIRAEVMERDRRVPPVEGARSYDEVLSGTRRATAPPMAQLPDPDLFQRQYVGKLYGP